MAYSSILKISKQHYDVFIYKIKKKPDRLKIGKLVWTGPNQHMLLVLMGHKNPLFCCTTQTEIPAIIFELGLH